MSHRVLSAVAGTAVLAAAACSGSAGAPGGAGAAGAAASEPALAVTAAFYPLEWASERVGGDLVEVTGLTAPGTEPHDLELTPKAVAGLAASDVVVHLRGFQPGVDEAVDTQARDAAHDVTADADLSIEGDPHFWLDPQRFAAVAAALGERFATADPANAATYRGNARVLVTDLEALDAELEQGLARCTVDDLVTAHASFGYLAQRYGFTQVGIAGTSPDAEPDAAAVADLTGRVRERGVTTVYTETLLDPALAETVARETGATVAVLDPIEGLTDASAGTDYLEVMRSNLQTLRTGQGCS